MCGHIPFPSVPKPIISSPPPQPDMPRNQLTGQGKAPGSGNSLVITSNWAPGPSPQTHIDTHSLPDFQALFVVWKEKLKRFVGLDHVPAILAHVELWGKGEAQLSHNSIPSQHPTLTHPSGPAAVQPSHSSPTETPSPAWEAKAESHPEWARQSSSGSESASWRCRSCPWQAVPP